MIDYKNMSPSLKAELVLLTMDAIEAEKEAERQYEEKAPHVDAK